MRKNIMRKNIMKSCSYICCVHWRWFSLQSMAVLSYDIIIFGPVVLANGISMIIKEKGGLANTYSESRDINVLGKWIYGS